MFDETNFDIAVPLEALDVPSIGKALIHRIVCIFNQPENFIVDKDRTLTGKVIQYILDCLKYTLTIISP